MWRERNIIDNSWVSSFCYGDDDQPQGINNLTSVVSNVFVFLDTSWPYRSVVDYVSYVLQHLNINPYASSVTLLTASNGDIIVNTTHYMSEFYMQWNITTHSWFTPGFSLPQILNTARDLAENIMYNDILNSSLGGQSLVALIMPSPTAFVTDYDLRYSMHFLNHLNYSVPDLHFIYYGGGALIRFKEFVLNPSEDLYPLSFDVDVPTSGNPVIERIRKIPRRLANPRCSYSSRSGSNQLIQYVHLGDINFYRMMPNYFFSPGSMRFLRIQPQSNIAFTVCTSRTIVLPHRNDSADTPNQHCDQTAATNGYNVDLTDLCTGYRRIVECPPMYVSVQAQTTKSVEQVVCKGRACQTPNEAQFLIYVNNLDCNAAKGMGGNVKNGVLILVLYFSTKLI